jgi:hypothetical protein
MRGTFNAAQLWRRNIENAFLQLQAPENLPPLDLMIVDDQTFGRIEVTANHKILDGHQIRIPDALRLIALKLHATRDPARRTTETDWQDVAGLYCGHEPKS